MVALDLDSTLVPFVDGVRTVTGIADIRAENLHTYDCIGRLCGSPEVTAAAFAEVWTFENQCRMGLLPGAQDALKAFQCAGIAVHVMTARPVSVAQATRRFLSSVGLNATSFVCDLDVDKVQRCLDLGVEVLVDDHPDTIERGVKAGLRLLSLSWPYNTEVISRYRVPTAPDWTQLLPLVLAAVRVPAAA
jgi:hypothetical protein